MWPMMTSNSNGSSPTKTPFKEILHKCFSDTDSTTKHNKKQHPSSPVNKCMLTLDGYNYVIVASPPGQKVTKDDSAIANSHSTSDAAKNGQLPKKAALTIFRRSNSSSCGSAVSKRIDSSGDDGGGIDDGGGGGQMTNLSACSYPEEEDIIEAVDLSSETLPPIDTPDVCDKAALRLRCLLRQLQKGEVSATLLQQNLNFAARVLESMYLEEAVRKTTEENDELSEVNPDAVPQEVREWLASTFTRQTAAVWRRGDEKPRFRSVAHAIRAGIFVDRMYRRLSSSNLLQFPSDVVKVLKNLDDWCFDVFLLHQASNGTPMKYLGYDLLNRYGIIHKFKISPSTLECCLNRMETGYGRHENPYHNNMHAADVAQTVHYVLCQTGLMNWLSDLEIFATLIAALIHDYDHNGTTNNFHVMSGTETALLYNDRAVLENHHISAAFRLMKEDDCNILLHLSRDEYREFRTLVIDMVLATDMSSHFQQIKNMRSFIAIDDSSSIDKSKALSLVLHCCDISHPSKQWDLHLRWTKLLLEEFFRQGDKENEMGLPFSPLCDRKNTLVAESQIGFIDFIVDPSMLVLGDMLEHILGPMAPAGASGSPGSNKESISEEAIPEPERRASVTNSPRKLKVKRPWAAYLIENKLRWKDQAAKEAELRALIQTSSNGDADSSKEPSPPAVET